MRREVRDVSRIRAMGYEVVRVDQADMKVGAVISRFALTVFDPRDERQVAYLRCSRQAEYLGFAWVEDEKGVRTEMRSFLDVLAALDRMRPKPKWRQAVAS